MGQVMAVVSQHVQSLLLDPLAHPGAGSDLRHVVRRPRQTGHESHALRRISRFMGMRTASQWTLNASLPSRRGTASIQRLTIERLTTEPSIAKLDTAIKHTRMVRKIVIWVPETISVCRFAAGLFGPGSASLYNRSRIAAVGFAAS